MSFAYNTSGASASATMRRKLRSGPFYPALRAIGRIRLAEILPFDFSTRSSTRSVTAS